MLSAEQIARIIGSELLIAENHDNYDKVAAAAEKIHELCMPDHSIHVAAAAMENEVTSTLMDLLAVTILATLIEQEGGGRTNISFSPGAMQAVVAEWDYTVETEGMVRTVRIKAKDGTSWMDSEPESKLGSLLYQERDDAPALDQAEPHKYTRPIWAMVWTGEDESRSHVMRANDRRDAERMLRSLDTRLIGRVENRWCLHEDCPASGCNHDPKLRDPEVTSKQMPASTEENDITRK